MFYVVSKFGASFYLWWQIVLENLPKKWNGGKQEIPDFLCVAAEFQNNWVSGISNYKSFIINIVY